jgi:hypothetical protein
MKGSIIMAKKINFEKILTPVFRVSFPQLGEPKAIAGQGEPKFGLKMLFPKSMTGKDLELFNNMKEACKKVSLEYFGGILPANLKKPFRDGDKDSTYPEDSGHWFCSARTNRRPGVVDSSLIEYKTVQEINNLIYAGCWARATLLVGATDTAGNKTCYLILQNIQKIKDDSPFSGRKSPVDEFDAIVADISETASDFAADTF